MGSRPYHCLPTPPPKGETGSLPLSKQPVSFKNQITTLLHPFTAFHPPPEGVGQFGHSAKWPKIKRFWTKIYKKNPGAFTLGGESGNKNQSVTAKKPVSHPPVTPWGGGDRTHLKQWHGPDSPSPVKTKAQLTTLRPLRWRISKKNTPITFTNVPSEKKTLLSEGFLVFDNKGELPTVSSYKWNG